MSCGSDSAVCFLFILIILISALPNVFSFVFAAKQTTDSSFQFATWRYTYDRGGVTNGNYFIDYESAKTDFGVRTGMIDKSKLFSETELKGLHGYLENYLQSETNLTYDDERAINSLIEKIEDIVPNISRNISEENDYEMEC